MDQINIPTEDIAKFADEEFEKALPTLIRFLEIPSQSRAFDPTYLTNGLLQSTAELLKNWIVEQDVKGLTYELLNDEGYSPFLFCEVPGSDPSDDTILFYGHMDKQPPFEGWLDGLHPYKPKMVDGKLYGRGGADDGYSIFGSVIALKACQKYGLKHPRVVMLFEGDEESGSHHIYHYLDRLRDKIGQVALVVCLDSGCGNYEQLWFTSTLRGFVGATFTVSVLKEGVHSGDASGVVPSSFRIARILLDRLEDPKTGEVHPDFQVVIPGQKYHEAQLSSEVVGKDLREKFPYVEGMQPVSDNAFITYINRAWKAQMEVIGADNLPKASEAGNVLRPRTTLKVSIRLPPTGDPEKAKKTITDLLTKDVPYGATVTIDSLVAAQGWNSPPNDPFVFETLNEASKAYYNQPALGFNEGGTIPLMNILQGLYPKSQFVVTGVLGPYSNAHGPNEFLHVPFTKKLIACMAHFVARTYPKFSKQ